MKNSGADHMTYEELMVLLKKNREEREAYQRGEIDDDMSEECRQNWIEKCNSQFSRDSLSDVLADKVAKQNDLICNEEDKK